MHYKTTVLPAALGALALAGCNTSTGTNSGAQTGAMMGAIGGGLLGATSNSGSRVLATAVGATIGAGLGGAIGSSLDAQAKDLRQDISNPNVNIVNTGSELVVTLPESITFATDSAVVGISAQRDLVTLAANLQKYPDSRVIVTGHTDSTGSRDHNMGLERRAQSVAQILTSNGVQQSRVSTLGAGPDRPVASNATPEGRAANRRVEIVIRPNGT